MRAGHGLMERFGRNNGRYHGETIEIDQVSADTHRLALKHGWTADTFLESADLTLRAYRRNSPGAARNLYLSAGIHGDEPSGPLAMLQLIEEDQWPAANIWLVPCLNPTGFPLNKRENSPGWDLNRDYRHLKTPEVAAHVAWLEKQPQFHLSLLLHEDWEANGFYVYELNPRKLPSYAEAIVEAAREGCAIETASRVDDWDCRAGIIRPEINPLDRPQWAEALYLSMNNALLNYTLETPSDFALSLRVETHVRTTRRALALFGQR